MSKQQNKHLDRLLSELKAQCLPDLSLDELISALHLISYPRTLEAICGVTRRLFELAECESEGLKGDEVPVFMHHPRIQNLKERVKILRAVANLKYMDRHFTESSQDKYSPTPLRGHTGDSPIAEAMLNGAWNPDDQIAYDQLIRWFVWVCVYYHNQKLSLDTYTSYLFAKKFTKKSRLVRTIPGSRIASAYRAIREFADPNKSESLHRLLELEFQLNEDYSTALSEHVQIAQKRRLAERWSRREALFDELGVSKEAFDRRSNIIRSEMKPSLRLILTALWNPGEDPVIIRDRRKHAAYHREKLKRPLVSRTGEIIHLSTPIQLSDGTLGTFKSYYTEPADMRDEEDEVEENNPLFTFSVWGDERNPIKEHFAAQTLLNHIEYTNALLPYHNRRLSKKAIRWLLEQLKPTLFDDGVQVGAKLILALSLVTGRSLTECSSVLIESGSNGLSESKKIGICPSSKRIYVMAGQAKTKGMLDGLKACHQDRGKILNIPIPEPLLPIINLFLDGKRLSSNRKQYVRASRKLIDEAPDYLDMSSAGISKAIVTEILHEKGDLGLLKVITDRTDANMQNIIHYPAYPVEMVNDCWRTSVDRLLEIRNESSLPGKGVSESDVEHQYVGSSQSIDLSYLKSLTERIKNDYTQAVESDNHAEIFNSISLNTALLANFALAARASLKPIPISMAEDGWALICDKQINLSNERVIPYTELLHKQIEVYATVVRHFALVDSRFRSIGDVYQQGLLKLYRINSEGEVEAYKPKDLEALGLPPNFGRKLIRTQCRGIGGRNLDAVLGHNAQGRKVWRSTSNFASRGLQRLYLSEVEQLQKDLGFELLTTPGLEVEPISIAEPDWQTVDPVNTKKKKYKEEQKKYDFHQELGATNKLLYESLCLPKEADANIALALADQYVLRFRTETDLADRAEQLARFMREQWGIRIHCDRPKSAAFKVDWLLKRRNFINLGICQRQILPRFHNDLEVLPSIKELLSNADREIGRFIMIAIWRLGVMDWKALDVFLGAVRSQPILACGKLRYYDLVVPCSLGSEFVQRTVFFEDYSKLYLTIEKFRLEKLLKKFWHKDKVVRRRRAQKALKVYFSSIGVKQPKITLKTLCEAAQLDVMLNSNPAISAYGSGRLPTNDLNDDEIRRNSGLKKREGYLAASVPFQIRGQVEIPYKSPVDVLLRKEDFVRRISSLRSPIITQIKKRVQEEKAKSQAEELIKGFALWLLSKAQKDGIPRFNKEGKKLYVNRVSIVGYTFLGFSGLFTESNTLDEYTLESLIEHSEQFVHGRDHASAWFQFKAFLRDKNSSAAKAGFEIKDLGRNADHIGHVKIIQPSDVNVVIDLLPSAKSGIGNENNRYAAAKCLALVSAYGLRRTEALMLRRVDVQVDLILIQPHGDHRLKTSWSMRRLPIEFAPQDIRKWLIKVADSDGQLIAPDNLKEIKGDNFFDYMNKLIQTVTQDPDAHTHIVRHTLASQLTLSSFTDSVDLGFLDEELPWIKDFMIPAERMQILFGGEGQSGHGLQAMAALLGHSHPRMSLRHYVHVMCFGLYAHLVRKNPINPIRSFENRLAGYSTMQRKAQEIRNSKRYSRLEGFSQSNFVTEHLLAFAEKKRPGAVHFDEVELDKVDIVQGAERAAGLIKAGIADPQINFYRFERLHKILINQTTELSRREQEKLMQRFVLLRGVGSGKRGVKMSRHPMIYRSKTLLPHDLRQGMNTNAAEAVCEWLEMLRLKSWDDYVWILEKWRDDVSRDGRIRLRNDQEIKRFLSLNILQNVRLDKKRTPPAKGRGGKDHVWGLIRFVNSNVKPTNKGASGIRWAMQWAIAISDC